MHRTSVDLSINGWFATTGLKFDLSAYRGRIIKQAELHLAKTNSDPNFALVAATINTDWNESSACWRYKTGTSDWTFPHSDFSTASLGQLRIPGMVSPIQRTAITSTYSVYGQDLDSEPTWTLPSCKHWS